MLLSVLFVICKIKVGFKPSIMLVLVLIVPEGIKTVHYVVYESTR